MKTPYTAWMVEYWKPGDPHRLQFAESEAAAKTAAAELKRLGYRVEWWEL